MTWYSINVLYYWFHVESVDRLHCYVQYSTLISCRECRPVALLCTVHYINFMLRVSTGCIAMYSTLHWFHVKSVDRCIRFSILINTVHSNAMSWVLTGCIAMYSTVHWFHVMSVKSIYFFLRFTLCLLIQSLRFTFWLITSLIIVRFWCSLHHWKALDLLFQNITSICICRYSRQETNVL